MNCFSAAIYRRSVSVLTALGMCALFFLCPAYASAENEADGFTEISDAAGLAAIADAPGGNYRLTADIDLGGSDWLPIPFSGRLDGGGHTLYNLRVIGVGSDKRLTRDGNLKPYDTEFAGLFSVLENAEVTDLHIKGAFVDISGRGDCFAAIFAGYADNCDVNGCSVSGRVHMDNSGNNAGVAGFVGYGTGKINNCSADVELVFEDNYRKGRCEQFLAGILSSGVGDINHCDVTINGYVSCHGYVHTGGVIGMYYHQDATRHRGNVCYNTVNGQISFFEDNPDRRAYCKDVIGERLSWPIQVRHNKSDFKRNETKKYTKVLSPEACDLPDYEETVIPSGCADWGYTEHKCRGCGYSWVDTYTPPQHEAGEWVTVSDSDTEKEGLRRQVCSRCGAVLGEEAIPVKAVSSSQGTVNTVLPAAAGGAAVAVFAALIIILTLRRKKSKGKEK